MIIFCKALSLVLFESSYVMNAWWTFKICRAGLDKWEPCIDKNPMVEAQWCDSYLYRCFLCRSGIGFFFFILKELSKGPIPKLFSSKEAKVKVFLLTMKKAKNKSCSKVHILSNAKEVFIYFFNNQKCPCASFGMDSYLRPRGSRTNA